MIKKAGWRTLQVAPERLAYIQPMRKRDCKSKKELTVYKSGLGNSGHNSGQNEANRSRV